MYRIYLLSIFLFISCIGTKPFGFRRVQFRIERAYYSKTHLKEITHTRRVYIKNCQGCKEVIKSRKKQFAEDGTLMYKERMKRRMYKAKLLKIKSRSYFSNGKLKEKQHLIHGKGYIKKYDEYGSLISKTKFKDWKPVKDSTASKTPF